MITMKRTSYCLVTVASALGIKKMSLSFSGWQQSIEMKPLNMLDRWSIYVTCLQQHMVLLCLVLQCETMIRGVLKMWFLFFLNFSYHVSLGGSKIDISNCNEGIDQDCVRMTERYGIESFETHPDFSQEHYTNDIGLIRLDRDVTMNGIYWSKLFVKTWLIHTLFYFRLYSSNMFTCCWWITDGFIW